VTALGGCELHDK